MRGASERVGCRRTHIGFAAEIPIFPPMPVKIETWLKPTSKGLYCEPGDFYVDPGSPAERAVVTHGHGDHARAGNKRVLATPETIEIGRAHV